MMGIGIGIDYVLLMVTRFREWRAAGLDPRGRHRRDARHRRPGGPGRRQHRRGQHARACSRWACRSCAAPPWSPSSAVLVVMAASVTLFPALLGYLGRHVDRLRLPLGRRAPGRRSPSAATSSRRAAGCAGAGWSTGTAGSPPCARRRSSCWRSPRRSSASASASPTPATTPRARQTRQAYDLLADGFGPGANGPLLLVAELPARRRATRWTGSPTTVRGTDGVAAVDRAVRSTRPATPRCSRSSRRPVRRRRRPRTWCDAARHARCRPRPTAPAPTCTSAASPRRRSTAPTTSPSASRCSSAAWCCCRCSCCCCPSAASRSRSRRRS